MITQEDIFDEILDNLKHRFHKQTVEVKRKSVESILVFLNKDLEDVKLRINRFKTLLDSYKD